jgi:hypothetical protein
MPRAPIQPNHRAAAIIARLLGPVALLAMLGALVAAALLPARDRASFIDQRAAGRFELPEPPPPDGEPGIDNRPLDPDARRAFEGKPLEVEPGGHKPAPGDPPPLGSDHRPGEPNGHRPVRSRERRSDDEASP